MTPSGPISGALSASLAFAFALSPLNAIADVGPPPIFKEVGVVENLNDPLPAALAFRDSEGKKVLLGEWFRGDKPVVLSLVYYQCPMLCNLVVSGLVRSLKESGLRLGADYRAVTVSIDPAEGPDLAIEKKRGYLQALGFPTDSADWGFLTGQAEEIGALAHAVGFRYAYDSQIKQFAHPAVIFVLTPEGKLSRYLYGVEYPPRDLRLSLVEAAGGRVGTSFDRVLLTCYRFDPASRKYAFFIKGFIRTGGLLVFVALSTLLAVLWRRELKGGTMA